MRAGRGAGRAGTGAIVLLRTAIVLIAARLARKLCASSTMRSFVDIDRTFDGQPRELGAILAQADTGRGQEQLFVDQRPGLLKPYLGRTPVVAGEVGVCGAVRVPRVGAVKAKTYRLKTVIAVIAKGETVKVKLALPAGVRSAIRRASPSSAGSSASS